MILCAGEALIDMLPRRAQDGQTAFAPYPGGAVFNTAIALGRLGIQTGFFTGLSTDLFGEMLEAALTESKVKNLSHRSHHPTTLAFVTLKNGQASYTFYDENTAGRLLNETDLPVLPNAVEAIFFGGISLITEPCGTAYETLAAREAQKRVIMLDPNIRPGFITDETAYRARLKRMIAFADIIKLSDQDLHWLLGAGEIQKHAQTLLTAGPKLVCITQGAGEAWAYTKNAEINVTTPRVIVADTVGAGDTFNAGIMSVLSNSKSLTKSKLSALPPDIIHAALTQGCKAAAITVSRAGANPPWEHEI